MFYGKKGKFMRLGQKEKLIWIVNVPNLSGLSRKYVSPRFETTGGIRWRIKVWSECVTKVTHLCSLTREKDNGPPEVHYSFYFVVSVEEERPEDGTIHRYSPMHVIFREGSKFNFSLTTLQILKRTVGPHQSAEPVKLILKMHLQRLSFQSLRANSLSLLTDAEKKYSTSHHCLRNNIYKGEKDVSVGEEKNKTEGGTNRDVRKNQIRVGGWDDEGNPWYPIFYQTNVPIMHEVRCHLLDINGQIHVSSEPRKYQSDPESEHRLHVIKKDDLYANVDIFSRNGEISLRMELEGVSEILRNRKSVSLFSPRKEADLRHDMTRFFRHRSENANLEIRVGGKIIKVHKEILAARSTVFNTMLSTNMTEKLSNIIVIRDFDFKTTKNFLKFCYCGSFQNNMGWQNVRNLYLAADKYFAPSLRRMCSRRLISCISSKNREQLLTLSTLFEDNELQLAVKYFKRRH